MELAGTIHEEDQTNSDFFSSGRTRKKKKKRQSDLLFHLVEKFVNNISRIKCIHSSGYA